MSTAAAGALAQAYTACEALARSHYENFPVASRLLPKAMRPHVAAVYAFARRADDIADEGTASGAARRAALDEWRGRLHEAVRMNADTTDAPVRSGFSRTDDQKLLAPAPPLPTARPPPL